MICVFRADSKRIVDLLPQGRIENGRVVSKDRVRWLNEHLQIAEIPEQDVSHLYAEDGSLKEAYYPDDVMTYTVFERKQLIDRETEKKINSNVHAFSPIGEQIGILRDQLVHVLNALGIEPTPEFARLNEIAIKEIEAAREKKEAINAQDNAA